MATCTSTSFASMPKNATVLICAVMRPQRHDEYRAILRGRMGNATVNRLAWTTLRHHKDINNTTYSNIQRTFRYPSLV
jgi:hypothetical protein